MGGSHLARVWSWIVQYAGVEAALTYPMACAACVVPLGVSGADLTLMSGAGVGESLCSTDEVGTRLEELRFTLGEGPCVDAYSSGLPVLVPELAADSSSRRWPVFAPAAVRAGARAMFVFPLLIDAIRLGVLVLHRKDAGPLTADQIAGAQLVAEVALTLLLDEQARIPLDTEGETSMLLAEVYQAAGMISVGLGVTVEEAMLRLRAQSFVHHCSIAELSRLVVTRRLRFTDLV